MYFISMTYGELSVIPQSVGCYCHFTGPLFIFHFTQKLMVTISIRTQDRLNNRVVRQGGGFGRPMPIKRAEITGHFCCKLSSLQLKSIPPSQVSYPCD
jgi:hypothetical protein